jgi:acetyltransferase-like isoleucine patch superfamily enzyme
MIRRMRSGVRGFALAARDRARKARFELWAARLRAELRARGGRLILDAPHGLAFDEPPFLRIKSGGAEGDGTFTLRIGERVTFGRAVELEVWAGGTNVLELDERSFVMDFAHISLRGGSIRLGPHASLRTGVIAKSEGELTLGRYSGLSHFSAVHCAERIELQDYAGTADRVTIVDSEKMIDGGDTYFLDQPLYTKPVLIERNTFIASNAVITAGTHIGPNAVVGANAVLTGKEYPGGWIIGGIPAKPLRALPQTEAAEKQAEASV